MSCCEPSATPDFRHLVPLDKGLSQEWLRSLRERGRPEIHTGSDLEHIGMPVGGICAGQVYLSGDGRLWHWDIFKAYGGSDVSYDPRGHHYAQPLPVASPFDQGFALLVQDGGGTQTRRLDASGFSDVRFEGRYPIGRVRYFDEDCPVEVSLEAFSPFIPLDEENSSLPATVMEYVVTNRTDASLTVNLAGWLENRVRRSDDAPGRGRRRNEAARSGGALMLCCHADPAPGIEPSPSGGCGDMCLALLDGADNGKACALMDDISEGNVPAESVFRNLSSAGVPPTATRPFGLKAVGAVGRKTTLAAGEKARWRFVLAWYFPAYSGGRVFHSYLDDLPDLARLRRHYAKRFGSSLEVASYLAENFPALASQTRLWADTWYDSTLPYWFLNRTFANASTLATQTCHWFDTGRFYGWEGVDCCQGTCQHVWQYAQSVARLFPRLERGVRERVDYGIAFKPDGSLDYRAEESHRDSGRRSENDADAFFAADGQCGTILRVYREHTMSEDAGFLSRIWPRVRQSIRFMSTLDANGDGLLEGPQFHTLDTTWHGEIPWISSLHLAALSAGKRMAVEMGDAAFAEECNAKLETGRRNFVKHLFNGEYFVHRPDPDRPDSMDLTEGCHIDQVFGQGYAMQLGLERVIPERETLSALAALWKYNYASDVGTYRSRFKEIEGGRWFAMPGEAGLLMCCWPRNDCNRGERSPTKLGLDVTSEGYLNECMSGFEYQAAGHMISEGMVDEGLAIVRSIHDRYHPAKRNPYNEVECSDHYSRAMASHGVYLSACGFRYHGPDGHLSFSPKLSPEDFRAAFTVARGWGTFAQAVGESSLSAGIHLKYGALELSTLSLARRSISEPRVAGCHLNDLEVTCRAEESDGEIHIEFARRIQLGAGDVLRVVIDHA